MTDNVTKFYDEFTLIQSRSGINHRHLSIIRHLEICGLKKTHSVLEIGCGIGTVSQLILQYLHLNSTYFGVDISPKSIQLAKNALGKYKNAEYVSADIINLEINLKFDFIVLPDVLEHIPKSSHMKLFFKLDSLLNDKGKIFIHIPHPEQIQWLETYSPEQLQVIDQPIEISDIDYAINSTSLKIDYVKSYSIYSIGKDYRIVVLNKGKEDYRK